MACFADTMLSRHASFGANMERVDGEESQEGEEEGRQEEVSFQQPCCEAPAKAGASSFLRSGSQPLRVSVCNSDAWRPASSHVVGGSMATPYLAQMAASAPMSGTPPAVAASSSANI